MVGVDFGHSHLRVAVGNLAHQVLAEESEPIDVDASAAQGFDRAEQLVGRLIETTGIGADKVIGVGLGVPGPDRRGDRGARLHRDPAGLERHQPARRSCPSRLGVPVHVDNDANLGALGELVWGSGRGVKDLAYIKVASGVGAGLVIDGRIYRGPGRHGGRDRPHHAGRVGPGVPLRQPRLPGDLHRRPATCWSCCAASHGPDLTMPRMVQLAREGDPGCRRVIADVGRHIGSGVANLCNLLNPSRVVLGGDLAEAGELVLGPIRESVARYAIPSAARQLSVLSRARWAVVRRCWAPWRWC